MIQSILFFALGFLTAGLIALTIAPAVWRRAVALTQKRIEASMPLSRNEIQASKDGLRAEYAMTTRRLEVNMKALREKSAGQMVEINGAREDIKRLVVERGQKEKAITELELAGEKLRLQLRRGEEKLRQTTESLTQAEALLEARALELEQLGRMYDEASFSSSTRQIELVSREAEYERLSGDHTKLRAQRKDTERRMREALVDSRRAQEALKVERKRVADIEKKLERLTATLSDREETLDRRDKELARLRGEGKGGPVLGTDLEMRLTEAQADRMRLEAELAEMAEQINLMAGAPPAEKKDAMGPLNRERDRLSERLAVLVRENRTLKGELGKAGRTKARNGGNGEPDNAALREQINDLAAEVVHLTALLDGPDSPINRALASEMPVEAAGEPGKIVSLAERIRALQKVAADA